MNIHSYHHFELTQTHEMASTTNQPATPRRSAVSAEQTRAAILAATTKVIAQHSLSGTTVERVAVGGGRGARRR